MFKVDEGTTILSKFDKEKLVFLSPLKRERENTAKITLEGGQTYIFVAALESPGQKGKFYLSVYFNQRLIDMDIKRVFHSEDKNVEKESVLPFLIPEEAEKMTQQVPVWKIMLVKESLRFMITDEDEDLD